MKNILVTGGLGFAGFNFIQYLKNNFDFKVVCLDSMIINDVFQPIKLDWLENNNVAFYKYSIIDSKISYVIEIEKIDTIVNFAGDLTKVLMDDNTDAATKVSTNIIGVYNLLELCKKYKVRFHNCIDSSVYGISPDENPIVVNEEYGLNPHDVTAATKAAGDLLIKSFFSTYKTQATVSRVGKLFGPWQVAGIIPFVVLNCVTEKVNTFGTTKDLVQYTYIEDYCRALACILLNGKVGQSYDITSRKLKGDEDLTDPGNTNYLRSVTQVTSALLMGFGYDPQKYLKIIPKRNEDAGVYLCGEKVRKQCKFKDRKSTFEDDMKFTIKWYADNVKKEDIKK